MVIEASHYITIAATAVATDAAPIAATLTLESENISYEKTS